MLREEEDLSRGIWMDTKWNGDLAKLSYIFSFFYSNSETAVLLLAGCTEVDDVISNHKFMAQMTQYNGYFRKNLAF